MLIKNNIYNDIRLFWSDRSMHHNDMSGWERQEPSGTSSMALINYYSMLRNEISHPASF